MNKDNQKIKMLFDPFLGSLLWCFYVWNTKFASGIWTIACVFL